jgi:hypothetical protein
LSASIEDDRGITVVVASEKRESPCRIDVKMKKYPATLPGLGSTQTHQELDRSAPENDVDRASHRRRLLDLRFSITQKTQKTRIESKAPE